MVTTNPLRVLENTVASYFTFAKSIKLEFVQWGPTHCLAEDTATIVQVTCYEALYQAFNEIDAGGVGGKYVLNN